MSDTREPAVEPPLDEDRDPLARFRNWRGFLFAAVAVNVLFVYGMVGNTADSSVAIWHKVLVWLPFNAIATALYLVFLLKLAHAGGLAGLRGLYAVVAVAMIVANWTVMLLV